ncbi:MAG: hypothetical protein NTX07_05995 [Solirubrobacterales bacterium]|nr:hypothetical protein [Solirubrobacterales bacterium]
MTFELPDYLCARLDRVAAERHMDRDDLIRQLLAGVVDRDTERVAAELRRVSRRQSGSVPPWTRAA